MRKLTVAVFTLVVASMIAFAQTTKPDEVEMEMMTYPEIYSAIHEHGKTTVLIYNGGTEQRGPHAILGGHTLMARAIAPMIARQLGNALVAPILPYSTNPAGGIERARSFAMTRSHSSAFFAGAATSAASSVNPAVQRRWL